MKILLSFVAACIGISYLPIQTTPSAGPIIPHLQDNIFIGSHLVLLSLQQYLKKDKTTAAISTLEAIYLTLLEQQKQHTFDQVSSLTGLTESALKQFIDKLCLDEIVTKNHYQILSLTDKGKALAKKINRISRKVTKALNHGFMEDEDFQLYFSITIQNCSSLLFDQSN